MLNDLDNSHSVSKSERGKTWPMKIWAKVLEHVFRLLSRHAPAAYKRLLRLQFYLLAGTRAPCATAGNYLYQALVLALPLLSS